MAVFCEAGSLTRRRERQNGGRADSTGSKREQTLWLLVRKRTIPTERPPVVGEICANFLGVESVAWSAQRIPTAANLGFLDLIINLPRRLKEHPEFE
jgi:hypothetical protein